MSKWKLINKYGGLYEPPKLPGIYAIIKVELLTNEKEILYIGTSSNLFSRLQKHEITRTLDAVLKAPSLYCVKIKVIPDDRKRIENEKKLIIKLHPPINYKHNTRL